MGHAEDKVGIKTFGPPPANGAVWRATVVKDYEQRVVLSSPINIRLKDVVPPRASSCEVCAATGAYDALQKASTILGVSPEYLHLECLEKI